MIIMHILHLIRLSNIHVHTHTHTHIYIYINTHTRIHLQSSLIMTIVTLFIKLQVLLYFNLTCVLCNTFTLMIC